MFFSIWGYSTLHLHANSNIKYSNFFETHNYKISQQLKNSIIQFQPNFSMIYAAPVSHPPKKLFYKPGGTEHRTFVFECSTMFAIFEHWNVRCWNIPNIIFANIWMFKWSMFECSLMIDFSNVRMFNVRMFFNCLLNLCSHVRMFAEHERTFEHWTKCSLFGDSCYKQVKFCQIYKVSKTVQQYRIMFATATYHQFFNFLKHWNYPVAISLLSALMEVTRVMTLVIKIILCDKTVN